MKKLTVFCAAACLAASAAAQNHPDLHEVLDRQKGRNLIEIPKGTYTLDVRSNGPYKFHNLTDVHINGNGSTVICNNQEQAFSFYNCVRVELRDPDHRLRSALLYAGRDYGRGRRRKLVRRPDRRGVSVTGLAANRVQFYDPQTRLLKRNSITTYTSNYSALKQLGHNLFRAVKNGTWSAGEQVGDLVVMDVKTDKPNAGVHTVMLNKCYNTKLENVTVYGSNTFSFFEKEGYANEYRNCVVDRGPMPQGIRPRLRSATPTAYTAVRHGKARPSRGAR